METTSPASTNIIRFTGARSADSTRRDQRVFMDAVYASGSLPIAAGDRATKAMATRLTIFGFVVLDEIEADGTARRLRPSEAIHASTERPWRVSRPSSRAMNHGDRISDLEIFAFQPA